MKRIITGLMLFIAAFASEAIAGTDQTALLDALRVENALINVNNPWSEGRVPNGFDIRADSIAAVDGGFRMTVAVSFIGSQSHLWSFEVVKNDEYREYRMRSIHLPRLIAVSDPYLYGPLAKLQRGESLSNDDKLIVLKIVEAMASIVAGEQM